MKKYNSEFSIERMCKVFKISRSGYYQWLKRKPSKRSLINKKLITTIKSIYTENRLVYGSPRITKELESRNIEVSRARVARLMKQENIRSKIKKKYVVTTDSKHSFKLAPNLLKRNFKTTLPGRAWVSDITYIRTKQGWLYLTVVLDLFDRKVIGWALSNSMKAIETTIPALKMAIKNRAKTSSLLFHSDRGVQYACDEFKNQLKNFKITQSMSRKANCWDNAVAESFFKSIKSECIYLNTFLNKLQAKMVIFEYIEIFYNRKRRHSSIGYLSPLEFEINFNKFAA